MLVTILISPRARTGPFGIGLPSGYEVFTSKLGKFTMKYPASWVAVETPQGSHGDGEIIAAILVPGRSFPQVYIARRFLANSDIDNIVAWGKGRAMIRNGYYEISSLEIKTPYVGGMLHEFSWQDPSFFGQVDLQCKDYYLPRGDTGYAISFCAETKQWEVIENVVSEMINSFMFISDE